MQGFSQLAWLALTPMRSWRPKACAPPAQRRALSCFSREMAAACQDLPESSSMSAGEAAELPSLLCFFGLPELDCDEDRLLLDLALGCGKDQANMLGRTEHWTPGTAKSRPGRGQITEGFIS